MSFPFSRCFLAGVLSLTLSACGGSEDLEVSDPELQESGPVSSDIGFEESELAALEVDIARGLTEAEQAMLPLGAGEITLLHQTSYGWGAFDPNADRFWLRDGASEGLGIGVHWRTSGRRGLCRHIAGAGWIRVCNKKFPHNRRIQVRLGRCNGSTVDCSKLSNWRDWTPWRETWTSIAG